VLRTFTLHMSIARPLGEGGKLQLTTDMTELEFALSAFVVDPVHPQRSGGGMHALGDEYRMLRAMRSVAAPVLTITALFLTSRLTGLSSSSTTYLWPSLSRQRECLLSLSFTTCWCARRCLYLMRYMDGKRLNMCAGWPSTRREMHLH
jgi:hypothetical protein